MSFVFSTYPHKPVLLFFQTYAHVYVSKAKLTWHKQDDKFKSLTYFWSNADKEVR